LPKAESVLFPSVELYNMQALFPGHKAEEHSDTDIFVKMKQTPLSSWEEQIQDFQSSRKAYFLI